MEPTAYEGCVPNALEEVDTNDIDSLELPLCEVNVPADDSTEEAGGYSIH